MSEAWVCSTCGETHQEIPFSFAADFPDPVASFSREEFENRVVAGSDQCILDGKNFFLRGLIEIPILGQDEPFLWGVWVTLWERDFDEISDCWEEAGREDHHGPFKGRIANKMGMVPDPFNLPVTVRLQRVGQRPVFFVDDPSHPLFLQQKNGISLQVARQISSMVLHGRIVTFEEGSHPILE
ncbi:DUF2199 domain-containing protein [Terriglobus albidus]|uniref:DUF2199 domain-containing protein n=1 Tax=Terriglobus albidus TaxID=1592106 RepID=UPI0021E05833|nr:DUF2199 domain-containing protein [Terriglobus albidus]